MTATRVGILGGTFDPIHFGHLGAAKAATECSELDRVILIPAGLPPHRSAVVAPAADRLEMTRLATVDNPRFEVSDVELRRAGPSYTADTLTELRRMHPEAELFLILGWDAAGQFNTWHQPGRVRELATIVVVGRPGSKAPHQADLEAAGLGGSGVVLCLRTTPAVSASEIRHAVATGKPIAGKLPPAVERYIAAHHLYGG